MIIGFAGSAGSGKDTAADALVRELGFVKMAFAEPIKWALNAMLRFKPSQWEDRAWKEEPDPILGVSPRRMAQTLGTEWARDSLDKNFWVKVMARRIHPGLRIAISDVRFNNEAYWIRSQGGVIIHLVNPNAPAVEQHQSEAGVDTKFTDYRFRCISAQEVERVAIDVAKEVLRGVQGSHTGTDGPNY